MGRCTGIIRLCNGVRKDISVMSSNPGMKSLGSMSLKALPIVAMQNSEPPPENSLACHNPSKCPPGDWWNLRASLGVGQFRSLVFGWRQRQVAGTGTVWPGINRVSHGLLGLTIFCSLLLHLCFPTQPCASPDAVTGSSQNSLLFLLPCFFAEVLLPRESIPSLLRLHHTSTP